MTLARRSSSGVCPPSGLNGFQTTISSRPTPSCTAVLRPRCWSGRNRTRPDFWNAHSKVALAFEDVQTMPSFLPHSALIAAVEFI